jgi:Zn-finger nucleic acid-binding protein
MNCPVCNTQMKRADRQGVRIDYCLKCHSVWPNHGELDKMIERSINMNDDRYEKREQREHSDDHRAYAPSKKLSPFTPR